ncbi:hypothetical protein HDU91_003977, partial [Kappamyces sp. JEL0680]
MVVDTVSDDQDASASPFKVSPHVVDALMTKYAKDTGVAVDHAPMSKANTLVEEADLPVPVPASVPISVAIKSDAPAPSMSRPGKPKSDKKGGLFRK